MTDDNFIQLMESYGYLGTRKLNTGEWAAINRFMFTWGLIVGLDKIGYRTRFCYGTQNEAVTALYTWDGHGDPPGPWIKEKGQVERANPLMFKGVPIVSDES